MPLPFDATLKDLIAADPAGWLSALGWIYRDPPRALPTDLSAVTAHADTVIGVGDPPSEVFDLEFQSARDPDLARRLLVYNTLLHHRYRVPVHTVLILLHRRADRGSIGRGEYGYAVNDVRGRVRFAFEVIRVWERPADELLHGGLAALPLAVLGGLPGGEPSHMALARVVGRVAERVRREAPEGQAGQLLTATFLLTGLRLGTRRAVQLFQGVRSMRESSTYQYILGEGRTDEARQVLLRQGRAKFGAPPKEVRDAIKAIDDLRRLQRLHLRLLKVDSWSDLLATR